MEGLLDFSARPDTGCEDTDVVGEYRALGEQWPWLVDGEASAVLLLAGRRWTDEFVSSAPWGTPSISAGSGDPS